jgi:hypothetical protein
MSLPQDLGDSETTQGEAKQVQNDVLLGKDEKMRVAPDISWEASLTSEEYLIDGQP